MRAIGIAGWSGAGKTSLIARLVPELARRGLSVSTIKHTHHDVDFDRPGKDSSVHRAVGAHETLLAGPRRLALIREHRNGPEPSLAELLGLLAPVDLVLIEGFRRERHRKIEVFRQSLGKPALWPQDSSVVAIAGDAPPTRLPQVSPDDVAAVADLAAAHAEDVRALVARLGEPR